VLAAKVWPSRRLGAITTETPDTRQIGKITILSFMVPTLVCFLRLAGNFGLVNQEGCSAALRQIGGWRDCRRPVPVPGGRNDSKAFRINEETILDSVSSAHQLPEIVEGWASLACWESGNLRLGIWSPWRSSSSLCCLLSALRWHDLHGFARAGLIIFNSCPGKIVDVPSAGSIRSICTYAFR
jgi:hypothetical protein